MSGFLLRIVLNAALLVMVVFELSGIFVDTFGGTLLGSAIIGLANAAIRPLLSTLAMPVSMATLGGFTVATNICAPLAVVKALPGYQITGVLAPLLGMLVLSLCSVALTKAIRDR
ncbi:MAG: phage holin family protein [Sporomusaceae bacterium]|nr:phage holin family protein [Sporomusaceae bacterium]